MTLEGRLGSLEAEQKWQDLAPVLGEDRVQALRRELGDASMDAILRYVTAAELLDIAVAWMDATVEEIQNMSDAELQAIADGEVSVEEVIHGD